MNWRNPGAAAALGAALLFGAGTPIAKLLLGPVSPWLLAGLLYVGSGVGLALWRAPRRAERARLGDVRRLLCSLARTRRPHGALTLSQFIEKRRKVFAAVGRRALCRAISRADPRGAKQQAPA